MQPIFIYKINFIGYLYNQHIPMWTQVTKIDFDKTTMQCNLSYILIDDSEILLALFFQVGGLNNIFVLDKASIYFIVGLFPFALANINHHIMLTKSS